jgi:2'-5' RNA ligase
VSTPATTARSLDAIHADIHAAGRRALLEDRVAVDPLPSDGGARWGISAVFRPPAWSSALTLCASDLARLLGHGHAIYEPGSLHVTLRQFENHRASVSTDDAHVRAYVDALSSVVGRRSPVTIDLRGLAASPAGIVVQGWPVDDLQALRRALHNALVAAGVRPTGPESDRDRIRETAHASLAIYGGQPRDPVALATFVDAHRRTDFGRYRFESVSIVGYRRTPTAVALIDYGTVGFSTS